jgi:hypothetical protein
MLDRFNLERRDRFLLLVIVGIGLTVRTLHLLALIKTPYPLIPVVWPESDMHMYWSWAQTIVAGDWLGRETYHPYLDWMMNLGSPDAWSRWWGGREIFQEAPLYAYWLAALVALGASPASVLAIQLVVGALQPLLIFALARRLFSARVGLFAAALTAVYGPFVFHEGTLLRLRYIAQLRPNEDATGHWPASLWDWLSSHVRASSSLRERH